MEVANIGGRANLSNSFSLMEGWSNYQKACAKIRFSFEDCMQYQVWSFLLVKLQETTQYYALRGKRMAKTRARTVEVSEIFLKKLGDGGATEGLSISEHVNRHRKPVSPTQRFKFCPCRSGSCR